MANAKKLPSGSWRVQVYLGKDENGKRIMKSITAKTKKEAEFLGAELRLRYKRSQNKETMTLRQACEKYIEDKKKTKELTTISGYKTIIENAFISIMDLPVPSITNEIMQNAIYQEIERPCNKKNGSISTKTFLNEFKFILSVIKRYYPEITFSNLDYPSRQKRQTRELPSPGELWLAVRKRNDKVLELAVLLAMWLTLTQSEIKGLTKSESISSDGEFLTVSSTVITVNGEEVKRPYGKTDKRTRILRIPDRIKTLISEIDSDVLVPYSRGKIYREFAKAIADSGISHISFHDLRHISATVAKSLGISDAVVQDRGGWSSDYVMKTTYMEMLLGDREKADIEIDDFYENDLKEAEKREQEKERKKEREKQKKKKESELPETLDISQDDLEKLLLF